MARHFFRIVWPVLIGLALSAQGRAQLFKCVDANGKVTYQGEKCATETKMDAMLYRDGSRASAGEVAAAEAVETDRRKLPVNVPKAGTERAPAAKSASAPRTKVPRSPNAALPQTGSTADP